MHYSGMTYAHIGQQFTYTHMHADTYDLIVADTDNLYVYLYIT